MSLLTFKIPTVDGKGNPKQHIALIEPCNNIGTDSGMIVKQFVRMLDNIAFDWYIT